MSMSSGDWPVHGASFAPRAGATVTINGTVQACVQHPGLGQRFLKTLTSLPSMVVWLGVRAGRGQRGEPVHPEERARESDQVQHAPQKEVAARRAA
jgi:hypothetical protein